MQIELNSWIFSPCKTATVANYPDQCQHRRSNQQNCRQYHREDVLQPWAASPLIFKFIVVSSAYRKNKWRHKWRNCRISHNFIFFVAIASGWRISWPNFFRFFFCIPISTHYTTYALHHFKCFVRIINVFCRTNECPAIKMKMEQHNRHCAICERVNVYYAVLCTG